MRTPANPFLIHLSNYLNDEIESVIEEIQVSKSAFIRQSIIRNLDITRNVEMPLLRRHYEESQDRLFGLISSLNDRKRNL